MLDRAARISRFLILPWRYRRSHIPESAEDWNAGKYSEEDPCEETSVDLVGEEGWN